MTARSATMTTTATLVSALLLCAAAPLGCQLFGLEPIRCDPKSDRTVNACPPGNTCSSTGFCTARVALDNCAASLAPASRDVHLSVAAAGVAAMDDKLYPGTSPTPSALFFDVHGCNRDAQTGCDGAHDNSSGLQPLGGVIASTADTFATALDAQPLTLPAGTISFARGITVEAVLRSRATAGAETTVASMGDDKDGWFITEGAAGLLSFKVGRLNIDLALPSPATWHHVLCAVGPHALDDNQQLDDALCTVDGNLAGPATLLADTARTFHDAPHDLVVGGTAQAPALSDAQVAVVRVWADGNATHATRTINREDGLVDEARRRLAQYVGLHAETPGPLRFLVTNTGGPPRALPVADRFVLVSGSWPRIAHLGVDGASGILLEPKRANRIAGTQLNCGGAAASPVVSPVDRADACRYGTVTHLGASVSPRPSASGLPDFGAGSALVFTAFLHGGAGAALTVAVDPGGPEAQLDDGDCRVTSDAGGALTLDDVASSKGCELVPFGDGWFRLVDRFTAAGSPVSVDLDVIGNLWSPQLGANPTTPFGYTAFNEQNNFVRISERSADEIVLDGVGLANASSTGVRATIGSDGTSLFMTPMFVADDADGSNRFALLELVPSGATVTPRLEVTEGATSIVFGRPFAWATGTTARIGGDLGPALDACSGCSVGAVNATLPANEQWEHIGLLGTGEPGIVIAADVLTSGTEPLALPFDLTTTTPQTGCLEGKQPDAAFVACNDGGCNEQTPITWTGDVQSVGEGPSVGEQAVTGTFSGTVDDPPAIEELYVELRFAPSGVDGDVLVVKDGADDVLRVSALGGDAVVTDAQKSEALRLPQAWARAGEWTQLSCWFGQLSRCVLNADTPIDLTTPFNLTDRKLEKITVGGDAAASVAFARLWPVRSQVAKREIERRVGARVAASFGLKAAPRRSGFDLVELRSTPGVITKGAATFDVGAHWPRLVDDGQGNPAYEAGGTEALAFDSRDLASLASSTIDLGFATAPVGASFALDSAEGALSVSLTDAGLRVDYQNGGVGGSAPFTDFDPKALTLGARGSMLTLERGGGSAALDKLNTASLTPFTHAQVRSTGSPLRLTKLRVGAR